MAEGGDALATLEFYNGPRPSGRRACRCSDGRFFDYRVYKAEFESYETGDTLRLFLTRNGSKIISEYNVREMAIRTVGGIDIDLYLLPAAAFLLAALVSIWLLYRCKRYMNELG